MLWLVVAGRMVAAEPGQLDASPGLFTVLAAVNAAGYDAELSSPNNHPLRAQVRQALAASNSPVIKELELLPRCSKYDG